MSKNIEAALKDIEDEMARQQSDIDAVYDVVDPLRAQLETLNSEVSVAQARAQKKADEVQKAYPENWLELKKGYGRLAATRMQLRETLKSLGK